MSHPGLSVQRNLKFFPFFELVRVPACTRLRPCDPFFGRGFDKYEHIAEVCPPGFYQQGNIENDCFYFPPASIFADQFFCSIKNKRVNYLIDTCNVLLTLKYYIGKSSPVNKLMHANFFAETVDKTFSDMLLEQKFTDYGVGIDDGAPMFGELRGHRAFTRGNAAQYSNDKLAITHGCTAYYIPAVSRQVKCGSEGRLKGVQRKLTRERKGAGAVPKCGRVIAGLAGYAMTWGRANYA